MRHLYTFSYSIFLNLLWIACGIAAILFDLVFDYFDWDLSFELLLITGLVTFAIVLPVGLLMDFSTFRKDSRRCASAGITYKEFLQMSSAEKQNLTGGPGNVGT